MASTLASRLSRHSAALAISITATALFMIYHLSPTVSYHLSPSRWTGAASVTLPSAWLSDAGHLKYAHGVAFGSKYTLLQEHAAGYSCDETEVLADGQTVCRNTISVLKSLWSNTKAQQRYLADEAARVEAEIAGQVAQLDVIEEKERTQEAEFSRTYENISTIAGKRILVIGDSLDRNWIASLVDVTSPSSHYRNYDLSSYIPPAEAPSSPSSPTESGHLGERGTAFSFHCATAIIPIAPSPSFSSEETSIAESFIPPLTRDLPSADNQFRIDLVFAFGVMNEGIKPTLPGKASDRVEALRQVIGGGMDDHDSRPYDAITINFGLWDLVGFQRRAYLATSADREPGLTIEWIAEYTQICERFIQSLRDTYGAHTPIYFRLVHVTGPGLVARGLMGLPPHLHAIAEEQMVPTFKPLRVAELRRAQINVAKKMGIKTINFAGKFEGYGTEITNDGTHPVTEANQVYAELMLRQLMAQ